MADPFKNSNPSLSGPASDGFSITPNDSVDLPTVTRALYFGASGDVTVLTMQGTQLSFVGIEAGTLLPLRVSRILATGTTATNIVGLV